MKIEELLKMLIEQVKKLENAKDIDFLLDVAHEMEETQGET